MSNLIRIDSQGKVKELQHAPFADEVDELQSYIRKNPAILGDNITIIAEQLDTGSKKRLDMLALEEVAEGVVRPAIVELKNVEADTDALLQVLRYANWALTNTDSVRLRAGQSRAKFQELDNSSVKVILVAPAVRDELLELSSYVVPTIDFGFLSFGRFKDSSGDLLVLDWKTPIVPRESITAVQQPWDWEKYERELKISRERIRLGRHLFDGLIGLNSDRGWALTPVFRKFYVTFKKSGYNVVLIEYWQKPCWLTVRLLKRPEELELAEIHPELKQYYDENYRRYTFKIESTSIDVADFSQYIEKALESV